MTTKSLSYCIYLVRAWKETSAHAEESSWRFALIASPTADRLGFTEPKAVCDALHAALVKMMEEDHAPESSHEE